MPFLCRELDHIPAHISNGFIFVQTAAPKHYSMKPQNITELLPNQILSKRKQLFSLPKHTHFERCAQL